MSSSPKVEDVLLGSTTNMETCKRCGRELKYRTFGDGYCKTCGIIVNRDLLPFRIEQRLKEARRLFQSSNRYKFNEWQRKNRVKINNRQKRIYKESLAKRKRVKAYHKLYNKLHPEKVKMYKEGKKEYEHSTKGKLRKSRVYFKKKLMEKQDEK